VSKRGNDDKKKRRFFALLERFNQLGRLLPSEEEVARGERLDDARLVLGEMKRVDRQIAALLNRAPFLSRDQ
jgi:hypothetical protein